MAEFDVTLSAMSGAAKNISIYTRQFKEEAEETYQAAEKLSEGWTGDASQTFAENMEKLHGWMKQLGEVIDTYTAHLNKARDTYEDADQTSAKNFR